ncbi:MAG TPA: YceI family protein [Ktedonobacteraceae bacterium]|nr:YceI family protein [Ktedonobacteraceae bacterium]
MTWNIDATHSHATFSVRYMLVSTVKGKFNVLSGTLNIDEANPANSSIEAEVDATSIDTNEPNRDNHLRSPDFFDVEKYPKLTFKSTKVEPAGDNEYKVTGDLTMHGVTKPVVFNVEYSGQAKDPSGSQHAGFSAKTKISRKEWGLTWNQLIETGGALVSDEVKIEVDLAAVTKA